MNRVKSEEIRQTVDSLLAGDALQDAIRYSSEELAMADSRLHSVYSSVDDPSARFEAMSELLSAGVIHADCLFRGHYYADTVTLCLTLLLMASADYRLDDSSIVPSSMALCYLALVALEAESPRLSDIASQVPDGEEHVRRTVSCLASVMYCLYNRFKDSSGPWGIRVYELLDGIKNDGIITAPFIDLFGQMVDPATPAAAIGDVIGRLRALGFRFGI